MKRLFVFTVLSLLLCFGFAQAQFITLDNVTTQHSATELYTSTSQATVFSIRVANSTGHNWTMANGFRIYSPDGLTWDALQPMSTDPANPNPNQTVFWSDVLMPPTYASVFANISGGTGSDADTVGFGSVAMSASQGVWDGFDDIAFTINVGIIGNPMEGKTICIDSTYYPPGGTWKWGSFTADPKTLSADWDGPHCFTMYVIPDLPPDAHGPANYSFSHCDIGTIPFTWTDVDDCAGGNDVVPEFYIIQGPGTIDPSSGVWSWSGETVPLSGNMTLEVGVRDLCGGSDHGATATVNLTVENEAPEFTAGCGAEISMSAGGSEYTMHDMDATDGCGDDLTFSIIADNADGDLSINSVTGVISFLATEADAAAPVVVTVEVTDGDMSATCDVTYGVSIGAFYQVRMGFVDQAFQGQVHDICIDLVAAPSEGIGGFDFLIAYDASAMSFQNAEGGSVFPDAQNENCGWEYFQYRYGANGNCSGGCPSGLLRVVGIAQTNNGGHDPVAGCGVGETLACMSFLVSNDRNLECQFAPIRFFWADCGDNTISTEDGMELFVSFRVFDFKGVDLAFLETEITDLEDVDDFPSFGGTEPRCLEGMPLKSEPNPNVDFQNGGIMIACAKLIDDRGDLNLNGLAYEIADAVMFTNYFVKGLTAFGTDLTTQQASIAASDANADGIALSIADLVYLIRVVIGDALPYPKTNPVAANYSTDNGIITVSTEMGAAAIVVAGNQVPTLTANNMEMQYAFDGENTRIIVSSMVAGATFSGSFIDVTDVISVEFATYDGTPVAGKDVPSNFSLDQNYPNPFNPTAMISFDLPTATNWTLTFYNVTGQVVETVDGFSEASTVEFEWNASELASGIYFYKLEAGSYSATKKAVLLK